MQYAIRTVQAAISNPWYLDPESAANVGEEVRNTPESDSATMQLETERRTVGFDSYDMSVRELLNMVGAGEINIAPVYQRKFVWDMKRQSEFIESVFLDIPIPPLFMATNRDGTWEVVDGVQRISTLIHFCGPAEQRKVLGKSRPLTLTDLDKLANFNTFTFESPPKGVQLKFWTRPLRVTVLNDKSDLNVRFDLFERLNSGGVILLPQEIRNCVYRGPFSDLLKEYAEKNDFSRVVRCESESQKEEFVLRYFAFLEKYREFDHSVNEFLNDYIAGANKKLPRTQILLIFDQTFAFLASELPSGIVRSRRKITPVNLFEAITVGTGLVFVARRTPRSGVVSQLLVDANLRQLTTAGTNTPRMVTGRIEFVRDRLA